MSAKDAKPFFVYLCYFPAVLFWGLDGYFLWQERMYRKLYDKVRTLSEDSIDYSMDTSSVREQTASWAETCLSKTLFAFHGTVIGTIILVMFLMIRGR